MFGNIDSGELTILTLIILILYVAVPVLLIVVVVRWGKRVLAALEQIAASTHPGRQ